MTRLTVGAAARVAGYGGADVLQIFLAILSWIVWEFIRGCSAYAQAMYPPIDPIDREWEITDFEAAKRPAPLCTDSTVAAAKPRLTLAVSNDQVVTKHRSEWQ